MDFVETEDRLMLRKAVAGIASRFGHDYYVERARAGEKASELWEAMAEGGYLGVNLPAEYGGGGMGIAELAVVCEECAAVGSPLLLMLVSPAICGTISPASAPPSSSSAGCPGWPPAGPRWPLPSPSPTPAPTATASRRWPPGDGDG